MKGEKMGNITINTEALKTGREWHRHKVQDGSNVFRILPPFGDIEVHNNYPYRKWSIAWLEDPISGGRRPYASPMTDGDSECPIYEFSQKVRSLFDSEKAKLEAAGLPKDVIKDKLSGLAELQWQVRLQHLYVYNACDKSGNVGLLELKSTAHKAMKKKMSQYIADYTQDPTSLNSDLKNDAGVWFNIIREGSGKDTVYSVEINRTSYKDESGELVFKSDRTPLPANVVENFNQLAYDLNTVYRRKSYAELKEILLYTLSVMGRTNPVALQIPGFEVAAADSPTNTTVRSSSSQSQSTSSQPVKVDVPVESAPAKPKVSLNLGEETATRNRASNTDLDDILAFADSIGQE